MSSIEPTDLDLPTLAALAGTAANDHLLTRLHASGYPGLRVSHGYVVQHLIERSPTIGELAGLLGVTQQAVSKIVLEMERMELVERRSDPGDSRIRRVALTEHGHRVLEVTRAARRELEASVAADPADLAAAKRTLVALLEQTSGLESVAGRRVRPPQD